MKLTLKSCQSGSILILAAVMLPVLVGLMMVVLSAGRQYAMYAKAQNAADAALLGAVGSATTTNVAKEFTNLFNANFPSGYLGSNSSPTIAVYGATTTNSSCSNSPGTVINPGDATSTTSG